MDPIRSRTGLLCRRFEKNAPDLRLYPWPGSTWGIKVQPEGKGRSHTRRLIPHWGFATSTSSIPEAAATGEQLTALQAVRDQIAADLQICVAMRDRAALYSRLVDVLARIEELEPATKKGDVVDEISARRAARGAGPAKGSTRAKNA